MRLSILVPVYNERTVVEASLKRVLEAPLPEQMTREIILVDDCSTDGSGEILERLAAEHCSIRLLRKSKNEGKGAAIRSAIAMATGEFCVVQDADLEYDPAEYSRLLKPLLEGNADAVFGSRYLSAEQRRVLPYWHSKMNEFLTMLSNMCSNLNLTDMETCYKLFRTDLLKSIPIRSDRFGFEPEITIKAAKRKLRVYEVPISYHGRTFEEGKKIGWKDGVKALGAILYFWMVDDLYVEPYGRGHLNNLTGTPRYVNWVTGLIRPSLGDRVLEVNAGIGNLSGRLMGRKLHYIATETDPLYLHALRNRFLRTPSVSVVELHPEAPDSFRAINHSVDSVLLANVLEYVEDPEALLNSMGESLNGGKLVLLAPNARWLFGSVDRTLGHRRRFNAPELRQMLERSGFTCESITAFNRAGAIAWFINGRVFGLRRISKLTLKLFDITVWFWKAVDRLIPFPGLTLLVVARRRS